MPIFFASEVAALLGLNKFKTRDEAILRVISSMPKFKPLIDRVKESTGAKTQKEIIDEAPQEIKASLQKAVASSIDSKCQKDIEETIQTFKKETTETLLKNAIEGKDTPVEFKAAAVRIAKKETTVEVETKKLEKSVVVDTLTSEIQKQRGTKMESAAEDKHGSDTGKAVTDRGSPVRFECDEYILVGYIDGMQDGAVLETKNRKRFWREPPMYDLIQLRCYMKMKGHLPGVLLECFPSGDSRKTHLEWDLDEWQSIHDNLCAVSEEISRLTLESAESIIRKVLTNS